MGGLSSCPDPHQLVPCLRFPPCKMSHLGLLSRGVASEACVCGQPEFLWEQRLEALSGPSPQRGLWLPFQRNLGKSFRNLPPQQLGKVILMLRPLAEVVETTAYTATHGAGKVLPGIEWCRTNSHVPMVTLGSLFLRPLHILLGSDLWTELTRLLASGLDGPWGRRRALGFSARQTRPAVAI